MPLILKGVNASAGTSVTIPSHAVGDLLIIYAFRNSSTTLPTAPVATGTVPNWVDIDHNGGGSTCASRSEQFVATATNHTSGVFTNATAVAAAVLSGQAATPIGGHLESGSTSGTGAVAPAITQTKTDGTSILLEFVGHRTVTAWSAAPSGYTLQASVATEVCCNTKNDTTSDGAMTQSATVSSSAGYRGCQIEILAAPTFTASDSEGITDATTVTNDFVRAPSDPVGLTDSAATNQDWVRAQADQVGATDSLATGLGFSPAATDSLGVTDSLTAATDFVQTPADSVGATDAFSFTEDWVREADDDIGVTDSAGFATDFVTANTDPVGLTDVLAIIAGYQQSWTDPVGVADSATFVLVAAGNIGADDLVGVSDTLSLGADYVRAFTDSVGVSDSAQLATDFARALADTVGASDELDLFADYTRSLTDPVGVTDSATITLGDRTVVLADVVGLTDAARFDVFTGPAADNLWTVGSESTVATLTAETATTAITESATAALTAESTTHTVAAESNQTQLSD